MDRAWEARLQSGRFRLPPTRINSQSLFLEGWGQKRREKKKKNKLSNETVENENEREISINYGHAATIVDDDDGGGGGWNLARLQISRSPEGIAPNIFLDNNQYPLWANINLESNPPKNLLAWRDPHGWFDLNLNKVYEKSFFSRLKSSSCTAHLHHDISLFLVVLHSTDDFALLRSRDSLLCVCECVRGVFIDLSFGHSPKAILTTTRRRCRNTMAAFHAVFVAENRETLRTVKCVSLLLAVALFVAISRNFPEGHIVTVMAGDGERKWRFRIGRKCVCLFGFGWTVGWTFNLWVYGRVLYANNG
jgi:hypothetical protein